MGAGRWNVWPGAVGRPTQNERSGDGGGEERISAAAFLRHGNPSVCGRHRAARAVVVVAESEMRCDRVSNLYAHLEDDDGLAAICCAMSALCSPVPDDHDPCADSSNGVLFSCGDRISSRL